MSVAYICQFSTENQKQTCSVCSHLSHKIVIIMEPDIDGVR